MNATGLSAAGGVGKVIAEWIANVDHCRITGQPKNGLYIASRIV